MYRLGIWLIALALVFNGAEAYAWDNSPAVPSAATQDHHDMIGGVDCDVQPGDAVAVADHPGTAHQHDNHLRCCGTCNVASLLPNVAVIPVTFSYRAAVFHAAHEYLVGHPVVLDPEIPKSIV